MHECSSDHGADQNSLKIFFGFEINQFKFKILRKSSHEITWYPGLGRQLDVRWAEAYKTCPVTAQEV